MSGYNYTSSMVNHDYYGYRVNNLYEERYYQNQPHHQNSGYNSTFQPPSEQGLPISNSGTTVEELMKTFSTTIAKIIQIEMIPLQKLVQEASRFKEEHLVWVQKMQRQIGELKTKVDRLKEQKLKTPSPLIWNDDEDDCPMIDPTPEINNNYDQEKDEEILLGLEKLVDDMSNQEESHSEVITVEEPLMPITVEVTVDVQANGKEVVFPLDHYIMNLEVEAPNPVKIFLGRYFTKVPRAKARPILPADGKMDGSYSEYSLKNHARKTIPFDNG